MSEKEIAKWLRDKCDKCNSGIEFVFGSVKVVYFGDCHQKPFTVRPHDISKWNEYDANEFDKIQRIIIAENEKEDAKSLIHRLFK